MIKKTVVITGGSRGIGRAIARVFAHFDHNVVISYRTAPTSLVEGIFAVRADVSDYDQAESLIKEAVDRFGAVDILINCAGIHQDSTVAKMLVEDWQRVLDVNLTGTFNCIKAAILVIREGGRIINISSVAGQVGVFGAANYAASKAGIFGLTKSIAREVARKGITVNALALGYFDIGMGERLPQSVKDKVVKQIPLGRFGRVDEVVAAVHFLAGEGASYITGQVIHVNGGYYV